MPRPLQALLEIVAVGVDVPDLAAGAQLLAVQVHAQVGVPRQRVGEAVVEAAHRVVGATEDVDHHGPAGPGRGRPEREVHDRPEVVLELRRDGAVLGPVPGVVRAHRELVDEHPPVGGLEELDGEDPGDVQRAGDPQRDLLGPPGQLRRQVRRGRHDLEADAVPLGGLHDGVRRGLAARRARHQRGQLAAEVDQLLGQQPDARGGRGVERLDALVGGAHEPDALAVVAAAHGLQDAGEAEFLDVGDRRHRRVPRAGDAQLVEPGPHDPLVLGVDERLRPGAYGEPVGLERVQVLGGDVLVVEGDHRTPLGDPAERVEVGVVADQVVGDDLGRRDSLRLGEQPQRQPEGDRRLRHHPGELATADDGEGGGERLGHGEKPRRRATRRRARPSRSAAPCRGSW